MKTTKKGFTLIELIVVIAIIGVLAALLVPQMLGYVKKSKISKADTACSSIQKGVDAGLTDLLAKTGNTAPANGWHAISGGNISAAITGSQLTEYTKEYFDLEKVAEGAIYLYKGSCIGVCCTIDGTYWGTWPTGLLNAKNHDKKEGSNNFINGSLAGAKALLADADDKIS